MKSLQILLVEDNLPLAKSTAKLIARLGGYQTQITDEPKVIFELCEAHKVDIVLMDINLPGVFWEDKEVSGADLSRLLKTKAKTAHIPIILLTAYAMMQERESFLANSLADEFVTKPISDYASLLAKIDKLTRNNRNHLQK